MVETHNPTWPVSLHQTFRLLPRESQSPSLRAFLESDGVHKDDILAKLPYHAERSSRGPEAQEPDSKRYRDPKQVYQTIGLLYESSEGRIRLTELGRATRRWLDLITPKNSVILGRHAAYALASCQLRNSTGAGKKIDASVRVFPFAFIWKAMLNLDGKISSDELNRALFRVTNLAELEPAIERIRSARTSGDVGSLGEEVATGKAKNDRIIPWMSLASFGWILFPDKRTTGTEFYQITEGTLELLRDASRMDTRHREFASPADYVEYVSGRANLPKDLR